MLATAYVLVLAIVALEVPLALSLKQRIDDEVRLQARSNADLVAVIAHEVIDRRTDADLQRIVERPARETRGRVVVVDADGVVIADSTEASLGRDLSGRPEIAAALGGRTVQFERESSTLGRDLLATAVPVLDGGGPIGAVRVTQDVAAAESAFRRALIGLVLVGVAVLSVGLLAGAVIAGQIARPLKRFETAARAVGAGDLDARAPVEGSVEQRSLAHAFNDMTGRLAASLRAQSRFVADASHQLRTPLTGLRLRLEDARARTADDALAEQLDRGMHEVDRLARTVDELLVLSQTGERDARAEPLDLGDAAARAAERWRPYAVSAGVELVVESKGDAVVRASRGDIDRVIDALVENAVNYSPAGGRVLLAVDGRSIGVRDHGPGPDPSEGDELFDRFHRGAAGAAHGEGTGLGLAIARELAARWGAGVSLTRAEGGGASARVTFAAESSAVGSGEDAS